MITIDESWPSSLPSFSIAMPCYNVENFVEEAIESVLQFQYDGDVQIVIVDDGSTDNTWQKIQQIIQSKGKKINICAVRHKTNRGVAAASDTAYKHSINDWLVKADADDIQMPNRLSTYAEIIRKHPRVCAIELACQRITEDGNPYEIIPFASETEGLAEYFQDSAQQRYKGRLGLDNEPCFCDFGGTVAFKRDLYLKWGNLVDNEENDIRFADDTVWGTRYTLSGPIAGSNVIACLYRTRFSGNLEFRAHGSSCADIIRQEIESAKSSAYKAESHKKAELCCIRAIRDSSLSDWKKEHILHYAHKHRHFALYFSVKTEWWNWSWFKRVAWYIINRKKLLPVHRGWCFKRLIPLRLAAFIRSIILKKRNGE